MYNIGDLVVYGKIGIFKIIDISTKDLSNETKEQLYYTLKSIYQDCTVYVPIQSPKVFIRPVITKQEAENLIDMIPSIQAEVYHSRVLSELTHHYEEILQKHSCADLIEMTMSLHTKKQMLREQKKKFGAVDEKFMKKAEDLLFGELGAALEISKTEVPDYISSRIKQIESQVK